MKGSDVQMGALSQLPLIVVVIVLLIILVISSIKNHNNVRSLVKGIERPVTLSTASSLDFQK